MLVETCLAFFVEHYIVEKNDRQIKKLDYFLSSSGVSEQPSQYLAMDLGYGGMAGSTLLVLRSTRKYLSGEDKSGSY